MPNIVTLPPNTSSIPGTVSLAVLNDWGGGFTGQVTIANTSGLATDGWEVVIDTADQLTGNWDSTLVSSKPGEYILSAASWNAHLAAGGSTTLGFNFDQASDTAPITVSLVQIGSSTAAAATTTTASTSTSSSTTSGSGTSTGSAASTSATATPTTPASTPGATATLAVTNDWGSGFTGQVTITNTGTTAISGWHVELDTNGHITGSWNSTVLSQSTGAYVLSNDSSNGTLAPGASTTLGFNMDRAASNPVITAAVTQLTSLSGTTTTTAAAATTTAATGTTATTTTPVATGTSTTGTSTTTGTGTGTTTATGTTTTTTPAVTGTSTTTTTGTTGTTGTTTTAATGTTTTTSSQAATAILAVTNDWGSGFTGQVTVTNTGSTAITGWEVEMDTKGHVTGDWNDTLISQSSGVILVGNASYNGTLAAGASTTFGFNMDRAAGDSTIAVGVKQVTGSTGTTTVASTGSTTVVTPVTTTATPSTTGSSTSTGSTTTTTATGTGHFQYLGVNLSGAEFGISDPTDGNVNIGTYGTDYTYPTHAEVDYYASEGLNVIRVPFSWERMQPTEDGALDKTQLGYLDDIVHYAATKGVSVLLDPHNYGYGYENLIGSSGTPDTAYANFWSQLATHYAGQSNVMFGLMNEPHVQSAQNWVAPTNDAIAAIRAAGATQEITVSGTDWTGGDSWITSGNAQIFAPQVVDPLHNMAFEIHQYSDSDGSGSSTAVVSTTIGAERLQAVTAWAEQTGNKLFLGEFGAGQDAASLANLNNMLGYMQQHTDVWQGGTEWGGGPWWGSYGFALDPVNGVTTPQVATLASYAPNHAVA